MTDSRPNRFRPWLIWLALDLAALGVAYAAAPDTVGENLRAPLMAVVGCVYLGVLATVCAARNGVPITLVVCVPILTLVPARLLWQYVPTPAGLSNAAATAVAERAAERLGRTTLAPPELAKTWADSERIAEAFPQHAERLRAAREKWVERLDAHTRQLTSGQLRPAEFDTQQHERTVIAQDLPEFRDGVLAAERAWGEFHARRLTERLATLSSDTDLRPTGEILVYGILEKRFPTSWRGSPRPRIPGWTGRRPASRRRSATPPPPRPPSIRRVERKRLRSLPRTPAGERPSGRRRRSGADGV